MARSLHTGWTARITRFVLAVLLFESITGLACTLGPFHAATEWGLLAHTLAGLVIALPLAWYLARHWLDYRRYNLSDTVLLGYAAGVSLLLCLLSGLVVTWQGLASTRMIPLWRNLHLWSTVALLTATIPHALLIVFRDRRRAHRPALGALMRTVLGANVAGVLVIVALALAYAGPVYENRFPEDYQYLYGEDRPFAPSLAQTSSGGALDADSLAGSETCGTSGCHTQILQEWQPSAHRYAAQDPLFQKVQQVMADQNGPESTRYCGGCHDPISLFSGSKNLYTKALTGQPGYREGISCLSCHGIRETDLQGNANYVMTQPASYLWQWRTEGLGKRASDFLIRTYPKQHNELSKRMFKAPEFCAGCHKQFIDQEVNRVGWVQLQNQYDNWKASHWFVKDSPEKTVECRECHMPLIESTDPARGDAIDYNRNPGDNKHRSHRFIAANTLVPEMLELEGWKEHVALTQDWLQGRFEIPEIASKWRQGPVVNMALEAPATAKPGSKIPIRLVLTANKVGHDFPTGPLDIIQSWVELRVTDPAGHEIYTSGTRDEKHFIAEGAFLFKAEPVDEHGNLIDRHNLWEMVGVRYRRALFPGYSDTVEYLVDCPATMAPSDRPRAQVEGRASKDFTVAPASPGVYQVTAKLMYRKVDQFLINFLLGEDSGLTAPVIEMNRVEKSIRIGDATTAGVSAGAAP